MATARAHRDKAFYGFKRGELDAGVQGSFVVLEELGDLAPQRRRDAVADKVLGAKVADGDSGLAREGVAAINDEGDVVLVDADGVEGVLLGAEGEDAELDGALEDLVWDATGKGSAGRRSGSAGRRGGRPRGTGAGSVRCTRWRPG